MPSHWCTCLRQSSSGKDDNLLTWLREDYEQLHRDTKWYWQESLRWQEEAKRDPAMEAAADSAQPAYCVSVPSQDSAMLRVASL
jgi:hypothetical protein